MTVSFAQQRDTLRRYRLVDHKGLGCRPAELDLLRQHLEATVATVSALEDHPDIAELLRERVRGGRRGAL